MLLELYAAIYTILFPHFDALPLERLMPPSRKMCQVEKLARFRVLRNLWLFKSGTTLHVFKSPRSQRDRQDTPYHGRDHCCRTSRNEKGVAELQVLCAKYGLRFSLSHGSAFDPFWTFAGHLYKSDQECPIESHYRLLSKAIKVSLRTHLFWSHIIVIGFCPSSLKARY